jgi:hypothetical protein
MEGSDGHSGHETKGATTMRRLILALVATFTLTLATAGAVAAGPSQQANCIGRNASSTAPGMLGPSISQIAHDAGGLGQFVGGNGSGAAPTNTCDT